MVAPRDPARRHEVLDVEPAGERKLAEHTLQLHLCREVRDDARLRLAAVRAHEVAGEEPAVDDFDRVLGDLGALARRVQHLELAGRELRSRVRVSALGVADELEKHIRA